MFLVQKKQCKTCIYRTDSALDIKRLESQIADPRMPGYFIGHRVCHHGPNRGENAVCCRGFWDRHKNDFTAGQLAQRFKFVKFVDVDRLKK